MPVVAAQKLYQKVVSELSTYIADNGMQSGDRLPTEAQLAERFGVSRTVIREAVKVLTTLGMVVARRGSGHYVVHRPDALMSEVANFSLALESGSMISLLEFRQILETKAAGLAAERITLRGLSDLDDALAVMCSAAERADVGAFHRGDAAFHQGIAEASGNTFLATTIVSVYGLSARATHTVMGYKGSLEASLTQHRAILAALRMGDARGARATMEAHINTTIVTHRRELAVRVLPNTGNSAGGEDAPDGRRAGRDGS